MKIKNIRIILLMITFLIILATTVYATTTGEINAKEVKLRKKPEESSSILDYIYKGDEVEILEKQGGWYKVKAKTSLGKVTGYVSQEVIDVQEDNSQDNVQQSDRVEDKAENKVEDNVENKETKPTNTIPDTPLVIISNNIEENKQYTLTQEVKVKALPLINSKEKAKITGNITVIEIINDWARVESDIESGWIRKNTLKNSISVSTPEVMAPEQEQPQEEVTVEKQPEEKPKQEETPKKQEPQKQEETKLNKVGYVSTDGLRVRKGPSTDTEEITSLSKNDEVQIIAQEGKWYKIDRDGKIGYVSSKYISDTKVVETTSRGGSTLRNENNDKTEEKLEEQPKEEQKEEIKVEENSAESQKTSSGITGNAVVEYAKQYLGYKYVSGGASPKAGFDCSGFTQYVYKHFGVSLNRTSSAQKNNGVSVSKDDLQPGDIVLFNNDANTKIGHVGIYIGDGNFIHASNPSDGVKITTLLSGYYKIRYVGARRVI